MLTLRKTLLNTFATGALVSASSSANAFDAGALAKLKISPVLRTPSSATIAKSSPSRAIIGNGRFEVAPAGTYAGMAKVIAEYQKISASTRQRIVHSDASAWLDASMQEVRDLGFEVATDESVPPEQAAIEVAIDVLKLCAAPNITEPAIVGDDNGGIEIYFKEGDHALLVTIRSDLTVNILDDAGDEQWRGKYKSSGRIWKKHLAERMTTMGEAA